MRFNPCRPCCGVNECTYFKDSFTNRSGNLAADGFNVIGSTRYSGVIGDWEVDISNTNLKCNTTDSPIYFKYDGEPLTLEGIISVNFATGDNFNFKIGSETVTITKVDDTKLQIDDVFFQVGSITGNPIINVNFKLPIHLDCTTLLSSGMPYCLNPNLAGVGSGYQYPSHFLIVNPGEILYNESNQDNLYIYDDIFDSSDVDIPVTRGYMKPVTIYSTSFIEYGFSADSGIRVENINFSYVLDHHNEIQYILFPSGLSNLAAGDIIFQKPETGNTVNINYLDFASPSAVEASLSTLYSGIVFTDYLYNESETDFVGYKFEFGGQSANTNWNLINISLNALSGIDSDYYSWPVSITGVIDGRLGCCSPYPARTCYHACYPSGLPDSISLYVDMVGPSFRTCIQSIDEYSACLSLCDGDCYSLPTGEICDCLNTQASCREDCLADTGNPFICTNMCPGDHYALNQTFILDKKTSYDSQEDLCIYECIIPSVSFSGINESAGNVDDVYQCQLFNFGEYTLRLGLHIGYYDCVQNQFGVSFEDISPIRLFDWEGFNFSFVDGDFCLGIGNSTVATGIVTQLFPDSVNGCILSNYYQGSINHTFKVDPSCTGVCEECGTTQNFDCGNILEDGQPIILEAYSTSPGAT